MRGEQRDELRQTQAHDDPEATTEPAKTSHISELSPRASLVARRTNWSERPRAHSSAPPSLDESQRELLMECFADHAGPRTQIDVGQLQRSLDVQDSFLAERVLAVFDKNKDGWVCRVEFFHNAPRLLFGSLLDKLRFAFRVHDLNSDGVIDRDELRRMIRLGLSEDGVRAGSEEVSRFADVLMAAADTSRDGRISFVEFETVAREHAEVLELIAKSEANWLARGREHTALLQPETVVQSKTRWQLSLRFIDNRIAKLVVLAIWISANAALCLEAVLRHQAAGDNIWIQVARGAGAALNLNGALILIPVARRFLTWVRRTPGLRALPVDDAMAFHRWVGHAAFGFALVHSAAHLGNHAATQVGLKALLERPAALSGLALLLVFCTIWLFALPRLRGAAGFRLFHNTHSLYPIWLALMLLHGPVFWIWASVPIAGYMIDRLLRRRGTTETRVLATKPLASGVTELTLHKPPGFEYAAGDYVFLKLPDLARHEWHPFTLSSAPERSTLGLHVRSLGDFTGALHELAKKREATRDDSTLSAFLDGPFGTASGHIFETRYAVLIGAGIGVTPFASVLESIVSRTAAGSSSLEKVHFYWLNRDAKSFEWFGKLLAELEEKDPAQLVEINVFMTRGRANSAALALNLARELTHDLGDLDLVTGLRSKTNMGNVDWHAELTQIAERHHPHLVDVFFCGPPGLGRTVRRVCRQLGMRFRQEHF